MSSTCSTSPITMKIYQHVRSVKRSKLAKFRDDISIEGVIWYDIKIWWRHIFVKNVGIALKLFDLVIAITCTNFYKLSQSRFWFTEIPSFTDVVYLWSHWLFPTTCYKWHGLKTRISIPVKFQFHFISKEKYSCRMRPQGGINKTFWHLGKK